MNQKQYEYIAKIIDYVMESLKQWSESIITITNSLLKVVIFIGAFYSLVSSVYYITIARNYSTWYATVFLLSSIVMLLFSIANDLSRRN